MTHARTAAAAALLLVASQIAGCSAGYFMQATAGQLALLNARRPVPEVLADPATTEQQRAKLEVALDALSFAHAELALPDNGSYRQYADLGRPYAVWNVFAAPEFSLTLRTWCFPVAGCVAYRGYFAEKDARAFARKLAERGDDVHVSGASAYSTLGYFRDPILGSALRLPDAALAGLIFHELAHQLLYVPDDTVFNESFATLIEQEGLVRWLASRGDSSGYCNFLRSTAREEEVHRLLDGTRERLLGIYGSPASVEERRAAKSEEIALLRQRYRELSSGWSSGPSFDAWFAGPINNAALGAVAAYDRLVGTLRVILDAEGGDLPSFYRRASRLARLGATDRAEVLSEITGESRLQGAAGCSP